MAIKSKTILFCCQRADLVNVKVELDVELEGDNNLNLVENNAIYDILDNIGDNSDGKVDGHEQLECKLKKRHRNYLTLLN